MKYTIYLNYNNGMLELEVEKKISDILLQIDNIILPDISQNDFGDFLIQSKLNFFESLKEYEGNVDILLYKVEKTFSPMDDELSFSFSLLNQ